ncbi:hypothetical protein [Pseudoduganella danionis]|uniref:glucosamine inositolphosphorylceramide transferase family protein n=1 Tax=Pseudoduganella danionis TaxID=1890295 RepID=UPI0035B03160
MKLHVVSSAPQLPLWARQMLERMLAQANVSWHGWTQVSNAVQAPSFWSRCYQQLDQRAMGRGIKIDRMATPADAPPASVAQWPLVAGAVQIPDAARQAWQTAGIDLVIWLLELPPASADTLHTLPIWGLTLDGSALAMHPQAGAHAMLHAPHLCETRLQDYAASPPTVLYRSLSAAVTNSLGATRQRALSKALAFMPRVLAAQLEQRQFTAPTQADPAGPLSPAPQPGGLTLLSGVVRRVLANRLERRRHLDQWQVAYSFNPTARWDQLEQFTFLEPPKEVFWADPMPLYWQGKHWILFEELPFAALRGHLLAMEVQADGRCGQPQALMSRDFHLSYPFVVKDGEQLYMVPETAATRRVELHRCVEFPGRWELQAVLVDGVNAVDATLHRHSDGRWWMWVSVVEEGAERGEELHLYYADQLLGPWQAHAANPVISDIRCARPAGPIMVTPTGLVRPAQNSADAYGHHIEWRQIQELSPTTYVETSLGDLRPQGNPAWLRMHTVAEADGLKVVDVMVRRAR